MAAMCAAPVMPREPPTTSTVPTERLWSSPPLGWTSAATPPSVSSHTSVSWSARRRDADGRHRDLAAEGAAGRDEVAHLGGVQRHGEVGHHGGAVHRAGAGADAAGDVDAHHGAGRLVDEGDGRGGAALGRAGEAGAEDGVHHDVGQFGDQHHVLVGLGPRAEGPHLHAQVVRDLQVQPRITCVLVVGGQGEHRDLDAGVEQLARHDEAVAAVVALAAEHHDLFRRRSARRISPATARPARSMRCPPGMPMPLMAMESTVRITSAVYRPTSSDSSISVPPSGRQPRRRPCRRCG